MNQKALWDLAVNPIEEYGPSVILIVAAAAVVAALIVVVVILLRKAKRAGQKLPAKPEENGPDQ